MNLTTTQTIALILIILVLAAWLYLVITKPKKPKPRVGARHYWLGVHGEDSIKIVGGTLGCIIGYVEHRPLNGDILLRHDAEGQEHEYIITNVQWDVSDGLRFTASIVEVES